MSASAPEWMRDINERELYYQISRVFEDYCGDKPAEYPAAEQSFIAVVNVVRDTIKENRPAIDIDLRPAQVTV